MLSQRNKNAFGNPWVIGLLGFFSVFLVANIIFIYLAFKQPPNLVVDDFYERGERYEQILKQAEQEQQLNWTGILITPQHIQRDQLQRYEVVVQGPQAENVDITAMTFEAYRPSNAKDDFKVLMNEVQPGLYGADIAFPLLGTWDIIVEVKQDDKRLLITKRLTVSAQ